MPAFCLFSIPGHALDPFNDTETEFLTQALSSPFIKPARNFDLMLRITTGKKYENVPTLHYNKLQTAIVKLSVTFEYILRSFSSTIERQLRFKLAHRSLLFHNESHLNWDRLH